MAAIASVRRRLPSALWAGAGPDGSPGGRDWHLTPVWTARHRTISLGIWVALDGCKSPAKKMSGYAFWIMGGCM